MTYQNNFNRTSGNFQNKFKKYRSFVIAQQFKNLEDAVNFMNNNLEINEGLSSRIQVTPKGEYLVVLIVKKFK